MTSFSYTCNTCGATVEISKSYRKRIGQANPERICRTCRLRGKVADHNKKWNIDDTGRICKSCNLYKPWCEYSGGTRDARVTRCKDCINKQYKTAWGTDPEFKKRMQENARRNHLLCTYGLTQEDVNDMLHKQKEMCAICKCSIVERHCIDHCHATGKIRGLLCDDCNIGLGKFKDREEVLLEAARYLHEAIQNSER